MRSKTDLYRQKGVNFFFSWCLVAAEINSQKNSLTE